MLGFAVCTLPRPTQVSEEDVYPKATQSRAPQFHRVLALLEGSWVVNWRIGVIIRIAIGIPLFGGVEPHLSHNR